MRNILRYSLALAALSTVAEVPAHAQDLCIPLITCISIGTGSGSGSGSGTASAPEISGSMVSTGFALVAGVAAMMPRRRRTGNEESK